MSQQKPPERDWLSGVLKSVDVEREDRWRFRADPATGDPPARGDRTGPMLRPRLFGGLVAAQAAVAAARTVPDLQPHSLHGYFLAPGDSERPLHYEVTPLKEGKNFHARQVVGRQGERIVFSLQASFLRPEPGFAHADAMPEAPPPEQVVHEPHPYWGPNPPVELRDCDQTDLSRAAVSGRRRVWMKPSAALPEDPTLHLALLVFASDMTLVRTGVMYHPALYQSRASSSLDHALWFHRPPRFDDWVLYVMRSPVAYAGRPLIEAAMYRRDGTRIMSAAQEGLIRPPPP